MWNCHQRIDIDEQTIPWKGRHKYRCYNPKKPDKFHLKLFALNDSETGYMSNFYPYEGKNEQRPPGVTATLYPLVKLLDHDQYKNQGHLLATDNWYTTMEALIFVKKTIGADYVGTVKANKKSLPKEAIFPKVGRGKKQRGDSKQMRVKLKNSNDYAYFVAWQDNKPVHILSTLRSYLTAVQRNGYDDARQWVRRTYSMPTVISQYNKTMGGTDRFDQNLSYYRPKLKTRSWMTRVLVHLLNACVVNAYIIYKHLYADNLPRGYGLLDYLELLITGLSYNETDLEQPSAPSKRTRKQWEHCYTRLEGVHTPVQRVEKDQKDRNMVRGRCILCSTRVTYQCIQCDVHLCIQEMIPGANYNCWGRFHTDIDISEKKTAVRAADI